MIVEQERYLEHFGVLGMKWGIRREDPTLTRPRSAQLNKNKNLIKAIGYAKSGKAYKTRVAIARTFLGEKRQQKNWDKSLTRLRAQNKRLRSGELFMSDRAQLLLGTSLFDMYVTGDLYLKNKNK